jgi:uncharacterized protein (TIGR03083 family)
MNRSLEQSLRWVEEGTELCRKAIAGLDEASYGAPSQLDGWTRKHLVAHLAANAEAIGRLVSWARTGEERRMYSSPEQRNADIEAGAKFSGEQLTSWFEQSARELAMAMAALADEAWQAKVVTAQGRTVAATETPWMRSREVMVHAVDLATGLTFADLPEDFLAALREDITSKRGAENVPAVRGSDADVTAYLAGRPYSGVTTPDGAPAPELPLWL